MTPDTRAQPDELDASIQLGGHPKAMLFSGKSSCSMRQLVLLLLLECASTALSSLEVAHTAAAAGKWLLTWSDEFEGSQINTR